MVQNRQVTLLGDSILKGIQVDLGDRRYRTHNEINVEALESEFQLSIHNDAHLEPRSARAAACWTGCWPGNCPAT